MFQSFVGGLCLFLTEKCTDCIIVTQKEARVIVHKVGFMYNKFKKQKGRSL